MPLLEFNLDGITALQNALNIPGFNPMLAAGIAELAGVDALGITSDDGEVGLGRFFHENSTLPLNWRLPIKEKSIESLMAFPSARVTFIDPYQDDFCMDFRAAPDMKGFFSQVKRGQPMTVAVRINNDLKQLKNAYKLGIDQVEIYATSSSTTGNPREQVESLESLAEVAQMANKYEMGVSLSGGVNYRELQQVLDLRMVDTIVVGKEILGKALFIGLENALRDLVFLFK